MSNIIDKIQVSGVTYDIGGTGGGGNPTVELTQAEYDALVSAGTVSADTYYIISDAPAVDISQYWTSAQTQSAITQATSGKASQSDLETVSGQVANKQDTLVSGTNIKTINNESILGSGNITIQGGGGTYTAGRGIDITGGEISVSLPISAGTGTNSILEGAAYESTAQNAHAEGEYTHATGQYSHAEGGVTYATNPAAHAEGYSTHANGNRSHAEGAESVADGDTSHAEGKDTRTKNFAEHASGAYNVSSSASTTFGDSGNTLFSVGNGTSDNARHNAFEIRQNGDIYITSGGTDIKLQDNLGGGGKAVTGGTNISVTTGATADTINCTLPISGINSNYSIEGLRSPFETQNNSTGYYNLLLGYGNKLLDYQNYNYIFGIGNEGGGSVGSSNRCQFIAGMGNRCKNSYESAFGSFNKNVTGTTNSTLFSVGNGTADNARHNAFEIRQNGDIYLTKDGQDVKLQDQLGGLSLVKLTQSAYDALSPNYDSNTLYVIVN